MRIARSARALKKANTPIESNAFPVMAGVPPPPSVHHEGKAPRTTKTAPKPLKRRPLLRLRRFPAPVWSRPIGFTELGLTERGGVELALQHANVTEVSVCLTKVEAVSNDELVRNLKPGPVNLHVHEATRRLIEQRHNAN